MNTNRILLLATTTAVLFTGAAGFGQVNQALRGGAGVAGTLPPMPPPPPPTAIGATAGASGAAGINSVANGAAGAATMIPNPPHGDAGMGVGVTAGAPGVSIRVDEKTDAWAALDFDGTMHRIDKVTLEARDSLFADVNARVKASDKALVAIGKHSDDFSASEREEFDASVKDVRVKEKALRRSEKEAKRADADHWADARTDLGARYTAYAQAVHHAQVTAAAASSAKAGAVSRAHDDVRTNANAQAQTEAAASAGR